jgi:organic radical activating enzyme
MTQTLIFLTNYCPNACPLCMTASGAWNHDQIDPYSLRDIQNSFVHICGGEPLTYSSIGEVIGDLFERQNEVMIYTSLPYGFEDAMMALIMEYPRLKARLSVSKSLSESNPAHNLMVEKAYHRMREKDMDVVVTGYDEEIANLSHLSFARRTDRMPSGRDHDGCDADGYGPLFDVRYSDGTRGTATLTKAHYIEASKSQCRD